VEALAAAVADADQVTILLTHGHVDHAGAAAALARRLGAPVAGAWSDVAEGEEGEDAAAGPPEGLAFRPLDDGASVPTDAGDLVARVARFRAHRLARIAGVGRARSAWPAATPEQLFQIVYGDAVPPALRPAARASLDALVEHVRTGPA